MKKCITLHIDKKEIKKAAKEAADELYSKEDIWTAQKWF